MVGRPRIDPARMRGCGFDPDDPQIARLIALATEVLGFPRHLSQHVGRLRDRARPPG